MGSDGQQTFPQQVRRPSSNRKPATLMSLHTRRINPTMRERGKKKRMRRSAGVLLRAEVRAIGGRFGRCLQTLCQASPLRLISPIGSRLANGSPYCTPIDQPQVAVCCRRR